MCAKGVVRNAAAEVDWHMHATPDTTISPKSVPAALDPNKMGH